MLYIYVRVLLDYCFHSVGIVPLVRGLTHMPPLISIAHFGRCSYLAALRV